MEIKRCKGVKAIRIASHNKKVLWWIVVLFIIFVGVCFLIRYAEAGSDILNSKRISAENLKEKFKEKINENINKNQDKGIRVLVRLSSSQTTNEKKISAKNNIFSKIGKEKFRHNYNGGFTVQVSEFELENLKKMPEIESVSIVPSRGLFLQDSVKIINSTLANNLSINGINFTGAGQTVCVIDSGVNYSHPDLGGCYGNNNLSSTCKVIGGFDFCSDDTECSYHDSDPMDVAGHGTHVSGIIAANGTIKGVAPDAKIVMIKACNSAGTCFDDDIAAGITWCTDNSSVFNISVISMSLGAGLYSDYCNNDTLAPYIDSAVAKNISVVISSGNDGKYANISAPSCVQSAIPVSATEKDDTIALYANTNRLVQLLAPGSNINSTYLSASGYGVLDGTSMAAPHVAASIAIINQYLKLTGKTRTPAQIESALNSTGKAVVNSESSGLTFYRINIYDALWSFNLTASQNSPANNSASNFNFSNFSCYSETGLYTTLSNLTFYLWNSSKSLIYNETKNITGTVNTTIFNYTFSLEDSYSWSCHVMNNISNSVMAGNYSFAYDITKPEINLISPADSYSTTDTSITFSFNITENNSVANCSLMIGNAISASNSSITNLSANQAITKTLSAGSYSWGINCTDSAGNTGNANSSRSLTINSPPVQSSSSSGGGGGGGGSSVQTYIPSEAQISQGYTKELKQEEKIKFSLSSGESHSVKISKIESAAALVTISSEPFNVTLYLGIPKKINLTSPDYYDLHLLLNSVSSGKANITIQTISEKIPKPDLNGSRQLHGDETAETETATEISNDNLYIAAIALIIIVFAFLIARKIKSKIQDKNKALKFAKKPKDKKIK